MTPQYRFQRRVVHAATRIDSVRHGLGVRRPAFGEVPLSNDEIFFGACRGLIPVPPFRIRKEIP